jgi:hypothetical protein
VGITKSDLERAIVLSLEKGRKSGQADTWWKKVAYIAIFSVLLFGGYCAFYGWQFGREYGYRQRMHMAFQDEKYMWERITELREEVRILQEKNHKLEMKNINLRYK